MKYCLNSLGLFCLLTGAGVAEGQAVVKMSVIEDDDSIHPNFLYVTGQLGSGEEDYVGSVFFGDYGFFFSNDKGRWAYMTEKNRSEIQRLGKGDQLTDSFSVSAANGVASLVVITIKGINDKAVISGNNTGVVWEDGRSRVLRALGQLEVTDVDAGESVFIDNSLTGSYGRLRINNTGAWIYTANNSLSTIQVLADGDSLKELFVVKSVDGTGHKVVVTIRGVNDLAKVDGVDVGTVIKDDDSEYEGFLYAEGKLEVIDGDNGEAGFTEDFRLANYGYFYINDTGQWGYLAINREADIQSLSKGDVLEESFSVSTIDGTSHKVKVKILGVEEAVARKPVSLTWSAPLVRENGNPLSFSEIGGYHMYYGSRSGDYVYDVDIEGGEVQSSVFSSFVAGTYYVVMTTYDTDGRESQYSDEFVLSLK